ncbi:MAG: hypothetical protein LBP57_00795 [Endomicrobium sp.]|nr:hypothetical protein [Endomicrobium sp.]
MERFNRTLREQFLNSYKGDLTDIEGLKRLFGIIAKRFIKG